jgi:putative ABC transport system permease protein
MLFRDTFSIALRAINTNKSRSLLTMLGIIIGVGSVTLMTSIGQSAESLILDQVSTLGAKSMVIFPSSLEQSNGIDQRSGFDALTFEDLTALERLSTIETIAPVIFVSSDVTYGREESSPQILGSTPEFFENQSIAIQEGRLFDQSDEDGTRFVATIGPDVVKDLFGDQNPVGRSIKIKEQSFAVIGVTKAIGSQFFQNVDDRIYIPFSTAKVVSGQKYVSYMTMQATDDTDVAMEDIKLLLRKRHSIKNPEDDPQKDDFIVRTAAQATDILGTVSLVLTLFLSAIAGISLVVGGIGIMNIMLVAVSERTREIGLRKAVGARKRDILLQFLIEAMMLTLIGGLIGIISGLLFAFLIFAVASKFIGGYIFAVSIPATILAVVMATTVGLVFGIYPARRAAELNPIEALRYE